MPYSAVRSAVQESTRAFVRAALSKSAWFSSLTPEELDGLAAACTFLRLAAGDVLFREGDPGDGLFVVVDGRIRVHMTTATGPVVLNSYGPGTIFGEIAVLDGRGRTAAAMASTATELLAIGRQEFFTFLEETPRYISRLLHLLAERIRANVHLY